MMPYRFHLLQAEMSGSGNYDYSGDGDDDDDDGDDDGEDDFDSGSGSGGDSVIYTDESEDFIMFIYFIQLKTRRSQLYNDFLILQCSINDIMKLGEIDVSSQVVIFF